MRRPWELAKASAAFFHLHLVVRVFNRGRLMEESAPGGVGAAAMAGSGVGGAGGTDTEEQAGVAE